MGFIVVIGGVVLVGQIITRTKEAKQSRWLTIYDGVVEGTFLVLGFVGLVTGSFEGVIGAAVLGIVLLLFGATCLMASHLQGEISQLRKK